MECPCAAAVVALFGLRVTAFAPAHLNQSFVNSACARRCALTFDEAADLKKAFLKCGSSADMQILRAKNHFLPSFNAAEESFGYVVKLAAHTSGRS